MERIESNEEEEEEEEVVIHLTSGNPQVNKGNHEYESKDKNNITGVVSPAVKWDLNTDKQTNNVNKQTKALMNMKERILQAWVSPAVKWDLDTSSFVPVYFPSG